MLVLLACGAGATSAQVPPDVRWWTFDTERFRVHFHDPALESAARRAAGHAELAYTELAAAFVAPPRGRIHLVIADNVDLANGFASSFPTNRVVAFVHPPLDQPALSHFDDWLKVLITHELAHLFHLDQAGGVWRPLRRVFGRTATLFPQYNTPGWIIEGLAVYYESRLTGAGRIRGTHHDMILRAASLEDAFFPIDRATGAPVAWPGGSARYVYGSLFVAHLVERYGEESVGRFVREIGGRLIPYRLDDVARRSFGVTFTAAWSEWQDSLRVRYGALADSLRAAGLTEPEVLTPEGRFALHPRIAADGAIAYASSTLREEPSTRLVRRDGQREVIADRSTLGPLSWFPDGTALLTAELELQDPYRIYSDLVRVERGGRRVRLTRGARLREPDLHPDGRRVVAIGHAPATNVLVVVDLETGEVRPLVEPAELVHWGAPRWSPDGSLIAVSQWREGGFYDVVLLAADGGLVRRLTADRAIDTDPTWSPDGRYVLFSSDRTGIANLYAYDLEADALHQVTNVVTGAFQPDVSPDGEWIAFSYYSARGYHVARLPFDPTSWRPATAAPGELAGGVDAAPLGGGDAVQAGGRVRRYTAGPTLLPRGWLPQLEYGSQLGLGLGMALDGQDVVGRHLWRTDAFVYLDETRFDARFNYRYRGWGNPVAELDAEQEWTVALENFPAVTQQGDTLYSHLFQREQRAAGLLRHSWPRWRAIYWLGGGPDVRQLHRVWDNPLFQRSIPLREFPLDLGLRLFGGYSSARGFGYSISPEQGVVLQFSGEARRYTRPFEGEERTRGYQRLIGLGQGYHALDWSGFARHAVGLRLAGGVETGEFGPGFSIGGVSGTAVSLIGGYGVPGTQRTFGVRGYPVGAQRGDRAAVATAEYRFPLLLVERGVRTWPFFLDRIWGDVFADAGAGWCTANCESRFLTSPRTPRPIASAGAELMVSTVLGYDLHLTLRGGAAVPLRPIPTAAGTAARPPVQFYLVAGRSF